MRSISTMRGDGGETSLAGGVRVSKASARVLRAAASSPIGPCRVSVTRPTSGALAVDGRRFMNRVSTLRATRSVVWRRPET